jgi:outer membrane protein assembly factor BamB
VVARRWWSFGLVVAVLGGLLAAQLQGLSATKLQPRPAAPAEWLRYAHDASGTGFAADAGDLTPATAAHLAAQRGWPIPAGIIFAQPLVGFQRLFWGSWDGWEHAIPLVQSSRVGGWTRYLGQTKVGGNCFPESGGIASTGALATIHFSSLDPARPVLFAGGGGNGGDRSAELFALDARNGDVIWQRSLGPAPQTVIWSSPLVYTYGSGQNRRTSVYVGVASFGDCPLVTGQLVQLDAATGRLQHTFDVVSPGCTGGGVWGSPTLDATDRAIFFPTGNSGGCVKTSTESPCTASAAEPCAFALVKVRASDLAYLDSWQVPPAQRVTDGNFGSVPTLFSGTDRFGHRRALVGLENKNGIYYAFDRGRLGGGPVWERRVAQGGELTESGQGGIVPSAFDGWRLYAAAGTTTIRGSTYRGSVRALDPGSGRVIWEHGFQSGPVTAALATSPGLVAVSAGTRLSIVETAHGHRVFKALATRGAIFTSPPTLCNGVVYVGDSAGYLWAYSVNGR